MPTLQDHLSAVETARLKALDEFYAATTALELAKQKLAALGVTKHTLLQMAQSEKVEKSNGVDQ